MIFSILGYVSAMSRLYLGYVSRLAPRLLVDEPVAALDLGERVAVADLLLVQLGLDLAQRVRLSGAQVL